MVGGVQAWPSMATSYLEASRSIFLDPFIAVRGGLILNTGEPQIPSMSSKIRAWVVKRILRHGELVLRLKLTCRECGQVGYMAIDKQTLRNMIEILETNP